MYQNEKYDSEYLLISLSFPVHLPGDFLLHGEPQIPLHKFTKSSSCLWHVQFEKQSGCIYTHRDVAEKA